MSLEEELAGQGWQRQSVNDEPRLSELVQTYEELGFEVRLEPFDPDTESGCTECMRVQAERYKVIYTRKATDTA